MSVRWGHITDQHFNDVAPPVASGLIPFGDKHWRQFSTASDIYDAALAQFVISNVGFVMQTGDVLDSLHSPNGYATAHANMLARRAETGPDTLTYYEVFGNHDASLEEDSSYPFNSYWTAVDNATNPGARSNEFVSGGSETIAYTFDRNGIRFIVLFGVFSTIDATYPTIGNDSGGGSQQEWLLTRLNETSLPVVIFTHTNLIENIRYSYANEPNFASIRTILETNTNQVQAVFSGHFHRNELGPWGSKLFITVNGIHYVQLRSSVLGANNGRNDDGTAADGSHYVIDLIPHAVNGMAQVEITGFIKGQTKPFKTFIGI